MISKREIGLAMAHGFAVWGGPVATVIASATVATVSVIFGKLQAGIAQAQRDIAASQRDIAHEKLKADLFDRRFKIYATMREACLHCMRKAHNSSWSELHALTNDIDTAVFLFGKNNAAWLIELRETIMSYASNSEVLLLTPNDDPTYASFQQELRKGLRLINQKFYEMPDRLKAEMGASEMDFIKRIPPV